MSIQSLTKNRPGDASNRRPLSRLLVRAVLIPAAFAVGMLVGQLSVAQSASPAKPVNPSDLNRVRPGQPAPAFELQDANGQMQTLASFQGSPVVLVFYRGSW